MPLSPIERTELVLANHILYQQGIVDGFGHVSRRDPEDPGVFWMARSMAPALVSEADLLPFNLDAEPLAEAAPPTYLERFIHSAIFRRRPDVNAVVHSHAPSIIPFGAATDARLLPIFHMASFLGEETPVFEIRTHAGDGSDLLIRNAALGEALADALGQNAVVLMRGHGATMVGSNIRKAVFRAVYAAQNAALQTAAIQLGGPIHYLSAAEARSATVTNESCVDRAWDLLVRTAQKAE